MAEMPIPIQATIEAATSPKSPIAGTVRPAGPAARGSRAGSSWVIDTDVPVWAAAPGQAAVLYDGDVVLGGGRIVRPRIPADPARLERDPVSVGA